MFKNLGNLANLMQQAQSMGGRLQEVNEQLAVQRVTATSGAGLVTVEMNGLGQMLRLEIDPSLIENKERDMIEDLVPAAVNEAVKKAKLLHAEHMKSLTAGLELPGLDDALAKFTGHNPD